MAINKKLLRRVRNHILEEPRRYDQCNVGVHVSTRESPCGTRACIAGWAYFLDTGENPADAYSVLRHAQHALGLTEEEADLLFTAFPYWQPMNNEDDDFDGWPEPFRTRYHKARSFAQRARVAADYINFIIREGRVS